MFGYERKKIKDVKGETKMKRKLVETRKCEKNNKKIKWKWTKRRGRREEERGIIIKKNNNHMNRINTSDATT